VFSAAAMLTSAGIYFVIWMREPIMISQLLTLAATVKDIPGCLKLVAKAITEPVVLLALPALPGVVLRLRPRWSLLLLFASTSFVLGAIADTQAGGNINYFFEALFAIVPLAVLGVLRLTMWARRDIAVAAFLSAVFLLHLLPPVLKRFPSGSVSRDVDSSNQAFLMAERALRGRHTFSTVPRLALLEPNPVLTEPYLFSYMQRVGKADSEPIVKRIGNGEFDVVINSVEDLPWRGVPHVAPDFRRAIDESYKPYCSMFGSLVFLPRSRPEDGSLVDQLKAARCVPHPADGNPSGEHRDGR